MCKIRFWQFRDCGGHILPRKNANFAVLRLHLIDPCSIEHNSACNIILIFMWYCVNGVLIDISSERYN